MALARQMLGDGPIPIASPSLAPAMPATPPSGLATIFAALVAAFRRT
ncbi:hypothetical protein V1281_000697 [Nitrobacteraceae bacterium AZCC 2161]